MERMQADGTQAGGVAISKPRGTRDRDLERGEIARANSLVGARPGAKMIQLEGEVLQVQMAG